jgi:FkbM family methyltransferase
MHKVQHLSAHNTFRGKLYAAQTLTSLIRYLSNWPEVWAAYREHRPIPALYLRGGMVLLHGVGDDPIYSFREMFVERPYCRAGFYKPQIGDSIVDIGANIGWFALFMQFRARGLTIHCFEPAAATFQRLRANVEANALSDRVFVYSFAVSDRNAISRLSNHPHSVESSLVVNSQSQSESEMVRTIKLEEALERCGTSRIDLLKIDVEGSEVEIVLGSDPRIWRSIKRVAVEYHEYIRPGCRQALVKALQQRGFDSVTNETADSNRNRGIIRARRREEPL